MLFHVGSVLVPAYGVAAALGVLAALALAQRTARQAGLDPNRIWNLSIAALFAAILASRTLLVALNFAALRLHPAWLLSLAMVHHPLLAAIGVLAALVVAGVYGRALGLQLWTTADALAAPLALGLAFEQLGALLAGSGYGSETAARWAIVYTNPLAALWSGAPLGVAVHPVQAYAALADLLLAFALLAVLPRRRQAGDAAGLLLAGLGVQVFLTEFFRDPEGRGSLFHGAVDGPQAAAAVLVVVAALVLRERKSASIAAPSIAKPASTHSGAAHD